MLKPFSSFFVVSSDNKERSLGLNRNRACECDVGNGSNNYHYPCENSTNHGQRSLWCKEILKKQY